MGSPCEIRVFGPSPEANERAAAQASGEIERLERKYTRFRDDSLTARINASAGDRSGIIVDDETAALLDYAEAAWQESDGRFDLTSGVLRRCWNFKSGRLPTTAQLAAVLECVGWQHVRWERPRLVLERRGMELDFGGVVKEYAADRAAEALRLHGREAALVDLGGDIRVVGPRPGGQPWWVGIRDPRAPERALVSLPMREGAVTTSGDYERFMVVDGVRYAHILDPRTGWPVEGLRSVSVVAPLCIVAGSATTIAMLHGESGGRWLDDLGLPHLRVDREGRLAGPLAGRARATAEAADHGFGPAAASR
jgi:thiamine biosynthesis lipoprotein